MSGASQAHKLAARKRRIAALEAENARLEAEVARLRGQLDARRDPAPSTSLHTALTRKPAQQAPGDAQAQRPFGFGKDVTA